jgi:hypothetical protein
MQLKVAYCVQTVRVKPTRWDNKNEKNNMKNANKKFTCHRDGTVSFYNGFTWERSKNIPAHVWRALTPGESTRANTAIHGLTAAEQKELRRERKTELAADRQTYAEMSQCERDAHDNL